MLRVYRQGTPITEFRADGNEPGEAFDARWFVNHPIEKFDDLYFASLVELIGDECARTFAFGIDGLLDHSKVTKAGSVDDVFPDAVVGVGGAVVGGAR